MPLSPLCWAFDRRIAILRFIMLLLNISRRLQRYYCGVCSHLYKVQTPRPAPSLVGGMAYNDSERLLQSYILCSSKYKVRLTSKPKMPNVSGNPRTDPAAWVKRMDIRSSAPCAAQVEANEEISFVSGADGRKQGASLQQSESVFFFFLSLPTRW